MRAIPWLMALICAAYAVTAYGNWQDTGWWWWLVALAVNGVCLGICLTFGVLMLRRNP